VDDAVALCMALKLAERCGYEMKLITTCFGNCSLDQVCVNVAKCLVACSPGSEVQGPRIVRGASRCLEGAVIDATFFHGQDGLGDAGLPEPPAAVVPTVGVNGDREAAVEIIALCREASSVGAVVSLVMLGPLTNLALALQQAGLLLALVVSPVCFVPTGTLAAHRLTAEFGDSAAAGTTSLQPLSCGQFAQAVGATAGGGQSAQRLAASKACPFWF
ncbi:unnamed protein product, partial [Polarella glacialis]